MKSTYDPFAHAEQLGIEVQYHPLRASNGLWVPDHRVIFLQPRMRVIHERSILAHEVAHAALGHRDDRPKHEVLADRAAAENLIDRDEILHLLNWTDDIAKVCLELQVTTKLFRVYVNVHRLAS
jgi:Zn-dependent peptidase ImmA (M78 family)